MSGPTAVVLDLGNVLIRWDPVAAVAAGVGEAQARAFVAGEVDFMAWNHRHDAGGSWDDGLAWLATEHPRWLPHGRAYVDHFEASIESLVAGTADVLADLKAAGVPTFALTNWSAELYPVAVARFPELGLFDDVVVSGEIGLAKPDPAVFEATATRIGHPHEAIFFADDSAANVTAARAAGWDAELFTDADALRGQLVARDLLPPS